MLILDGIFCDQTVYSTAMNAQKWDLGVESNVSCLPTHLKCFCKRETEVNSCQLLQSFLSVRNLRVISLFYKFGLHVTICGVRSKDLSLIKPGVVTMKQFQAILSGFNRFSSANLDTKEC